MDGLAQDPVVGSDGVRSGPEISSQNSCVSFLPRAAQRPAILGCLGLSPKEARFPSPWFRKEPWRGRRSHPWLTLVSPGHSLFAQLRRAGGGSDAVGLADVFKGDRPVVMDGHQGPLLCPHCWFKDDENLTHLPQQKPEQNKGRPNWKGPGLFWLWEMLAPMVPKKLCPGCFSALRCLAGILASWSAEVSQGGGSAPWHLASPAVGWERNQEEWPSRDAGRQGRACTLSCFCSPHPKSTCIQGAVPAGDL